MCIHAGAIDLLIVWSESSFKMGWIAFRNKFENSFETKEKKEKRIRKQKTLRSGKKLFLKTYQNFLLLFELKSILETMLGFDLDHVLKSGLN